MTTTKVYVITISEIYDLEFFSHTPLVFTNLEDAKSWLKEDAEIFTNDHKEDTIDGDEWVFENGEMQYEAYIDGRCSEYMYQSKITEVEVH